MLCGGRHCTKPVKLGTCPKFPMVMCKIPTNDTSADQCTYDSDCPGLERCCTAPCTGLRCLYPDMPADR
jgi:hypothetical protein